VVFSAEIDNEVGQLFKEYLMRNKKKFKGWLYVAILSELRQDAEAVRDAEKRDVSLGEVRYETDEQLMSREEAKEEAKRIAMSDTLEYRMEKWAKQHPGLSMSKAWNERVGTVVEEEQEEEEDHA